MCGEWRVVPGFVGGMVAGTETPGRIPAIVSRIAMGVVILGARRKTEVHQVGDGGLPLAAVKRTHGELR